jgi:hypothetical protein
MHTNDLLINKIRICLEKRRHAKKSDEREQIQIELDSLSEQYKKCKQNKIRYYPLSNSYQYPIMCSTNRSHYGNLCGTGSSIGISGIKIGY